MKKDYFFKFILLIIPISAVVLISSSGGRNDARSGSPGDGQSCMECHNTGGSFGSSVAITIDIPTGGYALNTDYNITVTNTSSASAHGFQLTAEKVSDNGKTGTFTAGTGSRTVNSNKSITHSNSGQNEWSFIWKSPTTDQGDVKFYVASVAANANGGTSGDQVKTASISGFSVLGLSKEVQLDFAIYPNPSTDNLNIQLPTGISKAEVKLFDLTGKLLKSINITSAKNEIDVKNLSAGMYLLKMNADGKTGLQRFIKTKN